MGYHVSVLVRIIGIKTVVKVCRRSKHSHKACSASAVKNKDMLSSSTKTTKAIVHYAKSYRPFELFVNENYKL